MNCNIKENNKNSTKLFQQMDYCYNKSLDFKRAGNCKQSQQNKTCIYVLLLRRLLRRPATDDTDACLKISLTW